MTEFATRHAAVKTALESVGIGETWMRHDIANIMALTTDLTSSIVQKVSSQALYHHLTNIPCGVIEQKDHKIYDVVQSGLVAAIGQYLGWDINKALELCANILEDVNAHDEAAAVRAMLETEVVA